MPATMVGSAKGRSISELTTPLPGNSSRTSTQAISVPATALTVTTINEAINVSSSAETACGLDTAFQNPSSPLSVERAATAASGMSAITLRYAMTTPRPSAAPGPRRTARRGRDRAGLAASGLPLALEDLRDLALVGIEQVVVDLRPAAELADLEQPRRVRVGLLVHQPRHHGAVALRGVDLLGGVASQVVDEGLGLPLLLRLRDRRGR